jgi:hypothetical protein
MTDLAADRGAAYLKGILLVSLVVRLAAVPLVHATSYLSDETEYIEIARGILEKGEFADSNGDRSVRAPLYPFFLSGVFTLSGGSVALAHVAGCLLGVAGVFFVFALAHRIWNDMKSALVAAAIAGLHPSLVIYSTLLLTETLYLVLLMGALVTAYDLEAGPSRGRAAGLGALAGLASLTRPVFLGFFPLLLLLLAARRGGVGKRYLALALAAWVVVLAPWTFRNTLLHGDLVIVGSGGGSSLLTGNNPFATGTWRNEPGFDPWLRERMADRGAGDPDTLSETQRAHLSGEIALEYMGQNPARAAELALKKSHIFWVYPVSHSDQGGALQATLVTFDIALWVGVLLGLAAGRQGGRWLIVIGAAACFFWLAQALLHSEARFRLPLVPLLALVAGEGLRVFADGTLRARALARPGARALLASGGVILAAVYGWTAYMAFTGAL